MIRNYFHTIGLNPNFRIADEGEMKLLKQDTAKEIIDESHRSGDPAFRKFADSYGSGSRGNGLEESTAMGVSTGYTFSMKYSTT